MVCPRPPARGHTDDPLTPVRLLCCAVRLMQRVPYEGVSRMQTSLRRKREPSLAPNPSLFRNHTDPAHRARCCCSAQTATVSCAEAWLLSLSRTFMRPVRLVPPRPGRTRTRTRTDVAPRDRAQTPAVSTSPTSSRASATACRRRAVRAALPTLAPAPVCSRPRLLVTRLRRVVCLPHDVQLRLQLR